MKCIKCGQELAENSSFCNYCGHNQNESLSEPSKASNKKNYIIIAAIAVAIIAVLVFFINGNSEVKAIDAIKNGDYETAINIYNEKIKGEAEKEKRFGNMILNEAEEVYKKYKLKEVEYQGSIDKINELLEFKVAQTDIARIKKKIEDLNNSRKSFEDAQNYLKEDNILQAVNKLKKVIEEDENYANAQAQIEELKKPYKEQVIKQIDELESKGQYDEILTLINQASSYLKNDSDLSYKKTHYQELKAELEIKQKEAKIQQLKDSQLMTVESLKIEGPGFLNSNDVYVVVKNNSDKVVKEYYVGILVFDNQGYPVVPEYKNENFISGLGVANIQPGKTFGNNHYWTIFGTQISKIKACVMSVSYHDGTEWINEYFDYWYENEKGMY